MGPELEPGPPVGPASRFYTGEFRGRPVYQCPVKGCGVQATDRARMTGDAWVRDHIRRRHPARPEPTVEQRARAAGLIIAKR